MYNMISYESKMMRVEDDILNLSSIINNRNAYPRKENNCVDDSNVVLIYDYHLGDTIIAGNKYLSGNTMMESRDLVLSYPHIGLRTGDTKYRI